MRIVVVDRKKCTPKKCASECLKFCPVARGGKEIIKIAELATIDEDLCIGCGVCSLVCDPDAIKMETRSLYETWSRSNGVLPRRTSRARIDSAASRSAPISTA